MDPYIAESSSNEWFSPLNNYVSKKTVKKLKTYGKKKLSSLKKNHC